MQRDKPNHVILTTEPMDGKAMVVDRITAAGVTTASGKPLQVAESPRFLHGIVEVRPIIMSSYGSRYPFETAIEGVFAAASCSYPCGPPKFEEQSGFTHQPEETRSEVIGFFDKHMVACSGAVVSE